MRFREVKNQVPCGWILLIFFITLFTFIWAYLEHNFPFSVLKARKWHIYTTHGGTCINQESFLGCAAEDILA